MKHRTAFVAALVALIVVAAVAAATPSLPGPGPDPSPEAACRMAPQCGVNADCDDVCGAGLGRCVHSNCPIRICKCR